MDHVVLNSRVPHLGGSAAQNIGQGMGAKCAQTNGSGAKNGAAENEGIADYG